MHNREWFRLSILSLSLMSHIIPTQGADIPSGIAGWVVRQSVQVIAGVMGVKTSDYLLKGNGHADAHYKIDTMIQENRQPHNVQSVKVDIDSTHQGGKGTTTKAKQQSGSQYEQYVLDEWQKQATQYDDKKLDDMIGLTEGNLNSAKADRSYYKQGTKARTELEDHINFEEQSLAQLKEIKESRQKERLSKEVTTLGATTAVLTSQTAGTSSTQVLQKATEEKKEGSKKKNDPANGPQAPKDPPPHESGKDIEFYEKDNPGKHGHQWRDEGGHFKEDTPTARELIRRAVKEGNYRGVKNGKYQYDWINPETGEQIWVETIGTKVHNHGINLKPWEVDAKGFLEKGPDYHRAPTGVIRCEATGAIVWPLVPALMDKLEREAEKPNPLPDTEVKKLADAAINNYLKENPISGIVIKMPTPAIPVTPKESIDHPTPGAHKEDGFIIPYKPGILEKAPKDYSDKYQWWPFTNDHLPSDFPEAPEVWAPPSKVAQYEAAVEAYKNKGSFSGGYKKYDAYGDTSHIWKKGDPAPDWAKPNWAKGIK